MADNDRTGAAVATKEAMPPPPPRGSNAVDITDSAEALAATLPRLTGGDVEEADVETWLQFLASSSDGRGTSVGDDSSTSTGVVPGHPATRQPPTARDAAVKVVRRRVLARLVALVNKGEIRDLEYSTAFYTGLFGMLARGWDQRAAWEWEGELQLAYFVVLGVMSVPEFDATSASPCVSREWLQVRPRATYR